MPTLLLRNGQVIDGTGAAPFKGNVLIDGDRIEAVIPEGAEIPATDEVIDVEGCAISPGFIDMHSHSDWMLWDQAHPAVLGCLLEQGVTTVVGGNCGVGFAPARPEQRDWLIGLMAGVEDIPAGALAAGLPWKWETYEEFLDYVDAAPSAMDVGLMVTHATVRAYVMGERSMGHTEPTPAELGAMVALVRSALAHGARSLWRGPR